MAMHGDSRSASTRDLTVAQRDGPRQHAEVVAARRELGARLAAYRTRADLTQHDLARRVGYVRSSVGNVETGRQRMPRQFWMQCDDILSAGGVLTAGYDRVEAAVRESAWATAGDTIPCTDVTRSATRTGEDVDPALVVHWSGLLRVLAGVHNLFGPGALHDAASRESAVIRRYRDTAVGELKTGLLGVEARWAEFASWTADNVGDRRGAARWLERALGLAHRAADAPMAAYVLMRQAQRAADRRDGAVAAALAERAAATAELSRRDRALCAVRQAQGLALRGERDPCATAIKTAYRLIAHADDDDDLGGNSDAIGTHCSIPYIRAHEAYCQLRLGRPVEAVLILEDVLGDWPHDQRQDEGVARAWLALSYCGTDRPAEAAREGSRALTVTTVATSARAMRTLGQLDVRLAGISGVHEVEQFRAAFSAATRSRTI